MTDAKQERELTIRIAIGAICVTLILLGAAAVGVARAKAEVDCGKTQPVQAQP